MVSNYWMFNKAELSQKKVLLSFMTSIPFKSIPKTVGEVDKMLHVCMEQDPAEFQKYFNIVVNKDFSNSPSNLTERDQIFIDVLREYRTSLEFETSKFLDSVEERFADRTGAVAEKISLICEEASKVILNYSNSQMAEIENKLNSEIAAAAKRYERVEHVIKIGDIEKKVEGVLPEEFDSILQLAANRVNCMMVGPAGCGKTFLAGKVAESLGLDFSAQSCSAGMSESILTGWLIPTGANGKFEYVQSEFVRIFENGGVFLFDEIDAADPNVLIIINSALANGQIFIPQRYNNPVVKRHKDFVAIAAANTYGNGADALYNARNALDAATLDRFRIGMVPVDYNEKVERALVGNKIYEWGINLRMMIKMKKIRKVMSTRVMIDAKKMTDAGWSIEQITESFFADWTEQEKAMLNVGGWKK